MKQKPYHIHFVCHGNTYRSRLAAAYMATIIDSRFVVSSSGIGTHRASLQTSEAYTQAVAKRHGLHYGITTHKTQTTNQALQQADVIVFMNKDVYEQALQKYDFDVRKAVVWRIADIPVSIREVYIAIRNVKPVLEIAERTYSKIQQHCNQLYGYLTETNWADIVDAHNHTTGMRLPNNWAGDRGLWHRGVHVVVQTADGKYVVGKRVKNIIFSPGMLELTLGGSIDAGETPLHAAIRETHEELDVVVPASCFKPLFVYRQHLHDNKQHKTARAYVYAYSVTLPMHSARLVPEPSEVAAVKLLSRRQVIHMLHTHRMAHFGKLVSGNSFYKRAIAQGALPA